MPLSMPPRQEAGMPNKGLLFRTGSPGRLTALERGTSQVDDNSNNYDNSSYDNSSYDKSFECLGFEWVPQYLPYEGSGFYLDGQFPDLSANTQNTCDAAYQTSQAYNGLDWQHLDSHLPLQQITTLIGNDSDVSRWVSSPIPRSMIQGLPLMQLDMTSSPLVDMPMQSWDLQYIHSSGPPMNEEQLTAILQLGQDTCACMSPFGRQTTGSTSMAHTPDMAWQTGTGSNSSTSPISSNDDQFICDYPSCKATRPSQKELK
ncbi:hypothetical protein B0H65DRAFT_540658 [Neurospora tetraspora]|uniref:Uncharacterized protein n=1 Tax=Neurospora tetraspora TaxID=94610 RepID=A0AAE0JDI1_9PEZI|nr:hypothetical protein B0H65DRAFT_540658 [Neurospora tetraspora]